MTSYRCLDSSFGPTVRYCSPSTGLQIVYSSRTNTLSTQGLHSTQILYNPKEILTPSATVHINRVLHTHPDPQPWPTEPKCSIEEERRSITSPCKRPRLRVTSSHPDLELIVPPFPDRIQYFEWYLVCLSGFWELCGEWAYLDALSP